MSKVVLLDAGPLGYAANPKHSTVSLACTRWVEAHLAAANRVVIPEIADYEVRRELLRASLLTSVAELDQLAKLLDFLPLTTTAMRKAAELWALARQHGRATANDRAMDCDVILAAQALTMSAHNVVIATTNVGHLARFVPAELWQNIAP